MESDILEKKTKLPFEVLIDQEKIHKRVAEMAEEITREYSDKLPVFVGVLKGCLIFMADLIRQCNFPLEIEFISASSYRKGTGSNDFLVLGGASTTELKDRHVIIVEGIIDSGRTAEAILSHLKLMEPASLELVTLLDKPGSHRNRLDIKQIGFSIGNEFVIGYGLDNTQKFRNLPYIGRVLDEK
ncbi:MAG: hypoxanthine phosphoribosyltransferase [candidate division Zixibacteria bacterium]|nr:hypoxanthine phosphoribosyltransferase [candidate division Zixibacteria bacterium]